MLIRFFFCILLNDIYQKKNVNSVFFFLVKMTDIFLGLFSANLDINLVDPGVLSLSLGSIHNFFLSTYFSRHLVKKLWFCVEGVVILAVCAPWGCSCAYASKTNVAKVFFYISFFLNQFHAFHKKTGGAANTIIAFFFQQRYFVCIIPTKIFLTQVQTNSQTNL